MKLQGEGLYITFDEYDRLANAKEDLDKMKENSSHPDIRNNPIFISITTENMDLNQQLQTAEHNMLTLRSELAECKEVIDKLNTAINKKGFKRDNPRQIELETRLK